MTKEITTASRLADIVAAKPSTATILDELGVDYCCGGNRSLLEVFDDAPDKAAALAAELNEVVVPEDRDWRGASTDELIDYILATHHVYTRKALGSIDPLLQQVMQAHFENHGESLAAIHQMFNALKADLELHLLKEEKLLFPAILSGHESAGSLLREMEDEHEGAGSILHKLQDQTKDFTPPDDACESYRELFRQLKALSADIHRHVHLENYVLAERVS